MRLKTWLTIIRALNFTSAGLLLCFQFWYMIALFVGFRSFFDFLLRIFAPAFMCFISVIIVISQFKYEKIVEQIKFMQHPVGLFLLNLFIASIMAFQFSTVFYSASIASSTLFIFIAIFFLVLHFIKPSGQNGLAQTQPDNSTSYSKA